MDENRHLILIDQKDKTSEIVHLQETASTITIRFQNSHKNYNYGKDRVKLLSNPTSISTKEYVVYLDNRVSFNISKILDFKSYVKIFYVNRNAVIYPKNQIRYVRNVLNETNIKNKFLYLKALAQSIKDDENNFLDNQYKKIDVINDESVLAQFLKPDKVKEHMFERVMIFPFGFNLSQEEAVTKALTNQISIIEGPPGTGKTQTILNILANLVVNNQTVAVASNNNTAIMNVFDKLEVFDLSFIVAGLGNSHNRKEFIANQKEYYPDSIMHIKKEFLVKDFELKEHTLKIKEMLHAQTKLAKVSQQLEALLVEQKHFSKLYDVRTTSIEDKQYFKNFSSKQLLSLWAEFEYLQTIHSNVSLWFKLKNLLKYRFFSWSVYQYKLDDIIAYLQSCFYLVKEQELTEELLKLQERLKAYNFEKMLTIHKNESMQLFKLHLSHRYKLKSRRKYFTSDDLWKNFEDVVDEYPVILSTTHALRSSSGKDFLYDYLIIDEASQVDLVAGSLALSCAKNVVIVGDLKQLPHIVDNRLQKSMTEIFNQYTLHPAYNYENSLLLSTSMLFHDLPQTLLKEHYRCHPLIIDFCNKKFYNDELVILSQFKGDEPPLILYKTAEGNHARGQYNQRQIDVIQNEILVNLTKRDVGIISPYRDQVKRLNDIVDESLGIEIDTVHKYQGREKDIIVLTTVVNKKNDFVDNPNLLNVAISRAKNQLYVVVSDNEKNRHMKDLINYIKYNNLEIQESKTFSIFDMLYQDYASYLNKYLSKVKNVSAYKSENLMNIIIENVLKRNDYLHLNKILHLSLNRLILDVTLLDAKELKFVQNPSAHLDFLIYNKVNKQPVLAIEVDGVAFHENNPLQLKRDKLKDDILKKYNIPIIRFATNGSNEEERLISKLQEINA